MDHVALPLDPDHVRAVRDLAGQVAELVASTGRVPSAPHITLVTYSALPSAAALAAVRAAVAPLVPFVVRAHGFGVFASSGRNDLNLHVPVVRAGPLDALHGAVVAALEDAGAVIAGWTDRDLWSPHITLVDRDLDSAAVGAAITRLTAHHHPSWHVPIERVQVRGSRRDDAPPDGDVALGPS